MQPDNIEHLMYVAAVSGLGICTLKKYFESIAEVAGKDGFFKSGPAKDVKAIFRETFKTIQWVIKLVSHVKGFRKKFENVKITKVGCALIKNDDDEELEVPIAILSTIEKCPRDLFSKVASIVSSNQELEIGLNVGGKIETVKITEETRRIFYIEEEDRDEILPELKDGDEVTLTGVVIRANESTQSLGFGYKDHIITCKPREGKHLADFKHALISQNSKHLYVPKMKLTGVVERKTLLL